MQTELEARRLAPGPCPSPQGNNLSPQGGLEGLTGELQLPLRRQGPDTPPPGRRGSRPDCVSHPSSLVQCMQLLVGSMSTLQAGVLTGSHKRSPVEDAPLPWFPILVVRLALGPKWNWLVQHKPILSPSKVLEPLAHPD